MKENLTPEQKEIAVKAAMAMHLVAFFRAADTEMESVRYYEEPDAFRFKMKSGYAFLVSAVKRRTNNFLAEIFHELQKQFKADVRREQFGPVRYLGGTVRDPLEHPE
jgi:hypothetical protein